MSLLHVEHHDGVAVLTLDDPRRRNALSLALCSEIAAALEELEGDESVGALVVTGAGPSFCAGADLSQLDGSREDGLLDIYEGFLRIARSELPSIAAVNGAAVGAGMNLALACDMRIVARSARFDTRFLDLGIHPGGGHTWMLRRAAGLQATMAAVVFGQVIDGPTAERVGLAWRCVADEELLDEAVRTASRAASVPRDLLRRTRRTIQELASCDDHDEAVRRELVEQLWSMDQPAFTTRLAALRQRIRAVD